METKGSFLTKIRGFFFDLKKVLRKPPLTLFAKCLEFDNSVLNSKFIFAKLF